MRKGLDKLVVNQSRINKDLDDNWVVISEGIQTILRREGYKNPYEVLKELTRGKDKVGKDEIWAFIDGLNVGDDVKKELRGLSPFNYFGV